MTILYKKINNRVESVESFDENIRLTDFLEHRKKENVIYEMKKIFSEIMNFNSKKNKSVIIYKKINGIENKINVNENIRLINIINEINKK